MKKIYLAGPISGARNYRTVFNVWAEIFRACGYAVMNPAVLPPDFDYAEYLHVDRAMIDTCDGVVFLPGWERSAGAQREHEYAIDTDRRIFEVTDIRAHGYYKFLLCHCGAELECSTVAEVAQTIARL